MYIYLFTKSKKEARFSCYQRQFKQKVPMKTPQFDLARTKDSPAYWHSTDTTQQNKENIPTSSSRIPRQLASAAGPSSNPRRPEH